MISVDQVQTFIDRGSPVVISWGQGTSATVLLVDIVDNCAISKHQMRFPLREITSITPADGRSSGTHRTGDGVRR